MAKVFIGIALVFMLATAGIGFVLKGRVDTLQTTLASTKSRVTSAEASAKTAKKEADDLALTRAWPDDWSGHRRRIDREVLEMVAWPPDQQPHIYVCGPNAFVETVAELLVGAGHPPARIRTERFGPTGS